MNRKSKTFTIKGREYIPINKTAARVVRNDDGYQTHVNLAVQIWKSPPFTYPPPNGKKDLSGTRRGRVTIIGWMENDAWAARCDCGRYMQRNGKKWRKGLNQKIYDDGCPYCVKDKARTQLAIKLASGNTHIR